MKSILRKMVRFSFLKRQKVLFNFDLVKTQNLVATGDPILTSNFSLVKLYENGLLLTARVLFKIRKTNKLKVIPFLSLFSFFGNEKSQPIIREMGSNLPMLVTTISPEVNARSVTGRFSQLLSSSARFWFSELELVGLGYRLTVRNLTLRFRLGFSHVIILPLPSSVWVLKRKKRILLYSVDRQVLTSFVSVLTKLKRMSAYKVKGLKKKEQTFKLKPGKKRAK